MSKIEIVSRYTVYETVTLFGSNENSLQEVNFGGTINSFDTEEEAINALVKAEKTYKEYLIIKTVFLRTN